MATRTRRRPSARLCGLLVAALLLVAGCQVRTEVDLTVLPNGSGSVTVAVALDAEAAARIPDLANQLRTTDLRKAGWTIIGPTPAPGGGVTVTARKRFARAADAGRVLSELTGPTGPLRDFSVSRTHSFASTSYGVKGTIDLSKGLATFGDAELTRLLDGKPFGRTPDELKLLLGGRPLAEAAPFALRVHLPGVARTYAARLGDPPVPVDSHRSITRTTPWLLAVGALAAFVLAIVVFIDGRRRPNRRLRRPSERGTGTYDRRPYQTIDAVGDRPVPGVGGLPSEVRIHPIDAQVPPPQPPVPPPPVARRSTAPDPAPSPGAAPRPAGPRPDPRRSAAGARPEGPSRPRRPGTAGSPGSADAPGRPRPPRPDQGGAAPRRPRPPIAGPDDAPGRPRPPRPDQRGPARPSRPSGPGGDAPRRPPPPSRPPRPDQADPTP